MPGESPDVVTSDSIDDKCIQEFSIDTLRNPAYLRRDAWHSFLRRDRVKATINASDELSSSDADEKWKLVNYSCDNPRVFLLLAATSLTRKLPLLRSSKFSDSDLPVQRKSERDTHSKVFPVEPGQDRPWRCFNERRGTGNSWDTAHVKQFVSTQWLCSAVVFENIPFQNHVHEDCPLPYIRLTNQAAAGGGFGRVFRLGLAKEHMKSTFGRYLRAATIEGASLKAYEVAIKQLRVEGAESEDLEHFFEKETCTLDTMRQLRHPHLIEAISVYSRGSDRCFLFPWARQGNLRQLWERSDDPADRDVTQWAWHQIRGLADGLKKLHANGIRHGDLKPENILIFDGDDESGRRPLVIADVGIAKFHAHETSRRRREGDITTYRSRTLRYEPPEIEIDKPEAISRRYDSWSLGCVLLEFIVWLVLGKPGQIRLQNKRLSAQPKVDRFWYQKKGVFGKGGKPVLHPAVTTWIKKELSPHLKKRPALQDLMDLVLHRLLVGPVESRAYIEEFCKKLEDIHNSCSADSSFLWNLSPTELTRHREAIAEVADDVVVPISQQRTSKLVDKWDTVVDPSMVRELLEGLKWTYWPGTRQLAHAPSRLCRNCTAIDFESHSIELKRSLQDLRESADGCTLCCFLDRRLSASEAKPQGPLRLVRVGTKVKLYSIDRPIISLYCDPGEFICGPPNTSPKANGRFQVSGPASPALPFAQLGLPLLPAAASPEQFALLNLLKHHCDDTHECMKPHQHSGTALPTRVIDVGGDGAEPIRLVETAQDPGVTGQYIALSHRWGDLSPGQRFCTYKHNIAQRKERILYDELPPSFRDAVRITRGLGVRYLWIDSLCIIQEDPVDWAAEAGRMEDVFSHAYCTIAASSASSSLAGFLGDRPPRDAIVLPTPGGAPLYLAEDVDDFRADVEHSILSSRGWVLQERALSRRTIFFTSTQIYWECGNGVVCETLAQMQNPQSRFIGDSDFPSFGLDFYKDERIRLVQHFYTEYSALNLSHDSDRNQAVAGLQRRIAQVFRSDAAYGVLWRWPERTLLWRAAQRGALTRIDYGRGSRCGPPPPSWSWMAYDGRITFMDIPFDGVEWTGRLRAPSDAAEDRRVSADANELCVSNEDLMARAVLDVKDAHFAEGLCKCVLVGKKKSGEESIAVHYVLLIRPVLAHELGDDVYERFGVAKLLASHLSGETSSVFII